MITTTSYSEKTKMLILGTLSGSLIFINPFAKTVGPGISVSKYSILDLHVFEK